MSENPIQTRPHQINPDKVNARVWPENLQIERQYYFDTDRNFSPNLQENIFLAMLVGIIDPNNLHFYVDLMSQTGEMSEDENNRRKLLNSLRQNNKLRVQRIDNTTFFTITNPNVSNNIIHREHIRTELRTISTNHTLREGMISMNISIEDDQASDILQTIVQTSFSQKEVQEAIDTSILKRMLKDLVNQAENKNWDISLIVNSREKSIIEKIKAIFELASKEQIAIQIPDFISEALMDQEVEEYEARVMGQPIMTESWTERRGYRNLPPTQVTLYKNDTFTTSGGSVYHFRLKMRFSNVRGEINESGEVTSRDCGYVLNIEVKSQDSINPTEAEMSEYLSVVSGLPATSMRIGFGNRRRES